METNSLIRAQSALALTSWLDAIERLDTLVLEIRHLQTNVIYCLREAELYRPLAFEEQYLWGTCMTSEKETFSWLSALKATRRPESELRELATAWIIPFSMLYDSERETTFAFAGRFCDLESREAIVKAVDERVCDAAILGEWKGDTRRHYHNLCVLQVLKTNIVRDKLILCYWAARAFRLNEGDFSQGGLNPRKSDIARFMFVRSGVLARSQMYVSRLGDLQAQFEKAVDFESEEDPKPLVGRRREQGMYTGFLAERCRDLRVEMNLLLNAIGAYGWQAKPSSIPPYLMHRWSHEFSSTNHLLDDPTGARPFDGGPSRERRTYFINTAYWMPERPDLQSVIAHEVAHGAMNDRYGNFGSPEFDLFDDPFAQLVRELHHCFEHTKLLRNDPGVAARDDPRYAVGEIVSDLLAAAVTGHAFLFALFHECAGVGLEDMFEDPSGNVDLDMADSLGQSIGGLPDLHWYYRIRVVCAWLETVHHRDPEGALIRMLVDGVEALADSMMQQAIELYWSDPEAEVAAWREFGEELCKVVKRAPVCADVKRWRQRRSEDSPGGHEERTDTSVDTSGQVGMFPRVSRRLPLTVRDYLFRMALRFKTGPGRLLSGFSDDKDGSLKDVLVAFDRYYLRAGEDWYYRSMWDELGLDDRGTEPMPEEVESGTLALLGHEHTLFTHLYDVPWESALLGALDFVCGGVVLDDLKKDRAYLCNNAEAWFDALHFRSGMGRELYQVALEFFLWQNRPPADRLALVVHIVKRLCARDEVENDLTAKLSRWLEGASGNAGGDNPTGRIWTELSALVRHVPEGRHVSISEADRERLLAFGAVNLRAAHPANYARLNLGDISSEKIRLFEKLEGYKLDELLGILRDGVGKEGSSLIDFLSLHQQGSGSDGRGANARSTMRRLLTSIDRGADRVQSEPGWLRAARGARLVMVSRMVIGGGALSLLKCRDPWESSPVVGERGFDGTRAYAPLLGRFDAFSQEAVRAMSRCTLPSIVLSGRDDGPDAQPSLPFLERKEQGLRFALHVDEAGARSAAECGDSPTSNSLAGVIGFQYISLTQRSSRLDFLARLIAGDAPGVQGGGPRGRAANEGEGLGSHFGPKDYAILTEGWADIVLVLYGDPERDLRRVFDASMRVYDDFLVDRTELLLTSSCLAAAAACPEAFSIVTRVRLRGSRQVEGTLGTLVGAERGGAEGLRVVHTPGTTDLTIEMHPKTPGARGTSVDYEKELERCLTPIAENVDRMVTTIGRLADDIAPSERKGS